VSSAATVRVHADDAHVKLEAGDPRHVGPFRLIGRLGAGGMGVVYLGVGARGETAAVKTLHRELLADTAFVARFRREVELSEHVQGQFTAEVYGASLEDDPPWLATEYVAGPTLARYVRDHGPLHAGQLVALAAGVVEGLLAIHSLGVVHRDLTAGNVLLAEDGPRIIDFGIARAPTSTLVTKTGAAIGTPGYIAPEAIRGADPAPAADIFSWASLICFAGLGRSAFGEGSSDQLLYRVLSGEAEIPDLPEPLRGLVVGALSIDPAERPSAQELVHALSGEAEATEELTAITALIAQNWSIDADVQTIEVATEARSPRSRRTRRVAVAAAAVVGALALAGFVAGPLLLEEDEPAGQESAMAPEAEPEDEADPEEVGNPDGEEEGEGEEEPEPQPEAVEPEIEASEPEVPRLEGEVTPLSANAEALLTLAEDNVGEIIYLDLQFPEDQISVSEDVIFVAGSYGADDPGCQQEPVYCGAEYLPRDLGEHTDSGLHNMRGRWRLYGYFAVVVIEGPFQGSFSVNLRAVPVDQV
jgi:eukaryotic-like serine/threonine-protein kinase